MKRKLINSVGKVQGKPLFLVILRPSEMPGERKVSGERVEEQDKGTGWTEVIIACTLLFRTLQ